MTTEPESTTDGPIVLVKIGGSTLGAEDTSFGDIAALRQTGTRPVIVHGGGPAITSWMAKLGIRAEFAGGLRVTDADSLEVATAVLAGTINKRLVAQMLDAGARAVGLSGADGPLMRGRITDPMLGYVAGEVDVDPSPVLSLLAGGFVPIVAPIAVDPEDRYHLLNVNADTAAGAIAVALGASTLVFLTDVDGILDSTGRVLRRVPLDAAEGLAGSGVVKGGMIPKLQACLAAARAGITAYIVNGTVAGALPSCLDGTSTGTVVA